MSHQITALEQNEQSSEMMNSILEYFKNYIKTYEIALTKQSFDFITSNATPIAVKPVKMLFPVNIVSELEKFAKVSSCFENAIQSAIKTENVSYVEGFLINKQFPIPVRHAWNVIAPSNSHFDITIELALHGDLNDSHRIAIFSTRDARLFKQWLECYDDITPLDFHLAHL